MGNMGHPCHPRGFHRGTPIAGWLLSGKILKTNRDDDWGYPCLGKPPYHLLHPSSSILLCTGHGALTFLPAAVPIAAKTTIRICLFWLPGAFTLMAAQDRECVSRTRLSSQACCAVRFVQPNGPLFAFASCFRVFQSSRLRQEAARLCGHMLSFLVFEIHHIKIYLLNASFNMWISNKSMKPPTNFLKGTILNCLVHCPLKGGRRLTSVSKGFN